MTLGMIFLLNGVTLHRCRTAPAGDADRADTSARVFGGGDLSRRSTGPSAIMLVMHFVLTMTRWGLHTIAIGGNLHRRQRERRQRQRIKIGNFVLCSVLGGFAGILESHAHRHDRPAAGRHGPDVLRASPAR